MSATRSNRSGRWVVAAIIAGVLIMTLVGIGTRSRARHHHLEQMRAGEATRARALNGLLGISHLRGLGRKYVYLPPRPGDRELSLHYAEAFDTVGGRVLAIAGFDMDLGGDHAVLLDGGVVFVLDAEGSFRHVAEGARVRVVGEGEDSRILLWSRDPRAPDHVLVELVDPKPRPALRFRGGTRLAAEGSLFVIGEPVAGEGAPRAATDALPLFRYETEGGCFAGPAGGPGTLFELDRAASPLWCPNARVR